LSLPERAAYQWHKLANGGQRIPPDPWRTWVFLGGRGAGKTRAGAEWLAAQAARRPRVALVGPTLHDVRTVMIEGPSGLRSLPNRAPPRYSSSLRRLDFENGAVAFAFSAEDPDSLRGPQFAAAWADEFCAWPRGDAVLANLRLGLRMGDDPRLMISTTPRPIPALRRLLAEPTTVRSDAPTASTPPTLSRLPGRPRPLYGGTRLAAQELEGRIVDAQGALWRMEDIVHAPAPARLDRVVVAVDPPASQHGPPAASSSSAGRRASPTCSPTSASAA
jgi:phage terminase large subunit-like protein